MGRGAPPNRLVEFGEAENFLSAVSTFSALASEIRQANDLFFFPSSAHAMQDLLTLIIGKPSPGSMIGFVMLSTTGPSSPDRPTHTHCTETLVQPCLSPSHHAFATPFCEKIRTSPSTKPPCSMFPVYPRNCRSAISLEIAGQHNSIRPSSISTFLASLSVSLTTVLELSVPEQDCFYLYCADIIHLFPSCPCQSPLPATT